MKLYIALGYFFFLMPFAYAQEPDTSKIISDTTQQKLLPVSPPIAEKIDSIPLLANPCEDTAYKRLSNEVWRDLSISDKNKLTRLSFECNEFNKGTNHGFREKEYGSRELFNELGSFHHFMGSIVCISSVVGIIITARQNVKGSFWIYSMEGIALCTGIWEFRIGSKLKRYSPEAK